MSGSSTRSVQPAECATADQQWVTSQEGWGGDPHSGQDPNQCPTSPIVISMSNSYPFTSVDGGVHFDLDADGAAEQTAWTAEGSTVAFLTLDRNGNGSVDSGGELFGDHTPRLAGGIGPNGFEALTDLDTNQDGYVDASDERWSDLVLWRDTNHDGVSQSSEVEPLSTSGIERIETAYHWTGHHDPYGNQLRYQGRAVLSDGRRIPIYDVYFVTRRP
jgi:hypothetical protein